MHFAAYGLHRERAYSYRTPKELSAPRPTVLSHHFDYTILYCGFTQGRKQDHAKHGILLLYLVKTDPATTSHLRPAQTISSLPGV